jgi:hypothetical protein
MIDRKSLLNISNTCASVAQSNDNIEIKEFLENVDFVNNLLNEIKDNTSRISKYHTEVYIVIN